jgi:hypothetical protein
MVKSLNAVRGDVIMLFSILIHRPVDSPRGSLSHQSAADYGYTKGLRLENIVFPHSSSITVPGPKRRRA